MEACGETVTHEAMMPEGLVLVLVCGGSVRRSDTPWGKVDRYVWKGATMRVDETATGEVIKRLRRAEGQIRGVIGMLEDGRDCADVVTQLAAVSRALDRAGFKIIASGLQQCVTAAEDGEDQTVNLERMEKLFLSLA
jgi:DNA-binding FrmR family transcriptional regulator